MNMNMNVDQSIFELHQEIKHLVAVCIDGSTLGLGLWPRLIGFDRRPVTTKEHKVVTNSRT